MATRCDCHWVPVMIDAALQTLWLRADDVVGCPAHARVRGGTREGTDSAA